MRRLLRMGPRVLPYRVLVLQGLWGPGLFCAGCKAAGQAVLGQVRRLQGGVGLSCRAWGLGFCTAGFSAARVMGCTWFCKFVSWFSSGFSVRGSRRFLRGLPGMEMG